MPKLITKRGQPISGGQGQWTPTPNRQLLNHAADTSTDGQNLVSASATPFRTSYGPATYPAPSNPEWTANANFAQDGRRFNKLTRNYNVRQMADPRFEDVGYEPNATKPRFKNGQSIISGYPTRGSRQVVGDINLPKGEVASIRKLGRTKAEADSWERGLRNYKRHGG